MRACPTNQFPDHQTREQLRTVSLMLMIAATFLCWRHGFAHGQEPDSDHVALNSNWEVSLDDGGTWQAIKVPGTIEDQIDVNFDGISLFRSNVKLDSPGGHRAFLVFNAVATHATVVLGGKKLGTHLGGWTPFEFEITDILQTHSDKDCVLEIRVEERVGHNTQGFLPVIAPHFGGIWQSVRIEFRDQVYFAEKDVKVTGNLARKQIELELPVVSDKPLYGSQLSIRYRLGNQTWSQPVPIQLDQNSVSPASGNRWMVTTQVPIDNPDIWSPDNPNLYELEFVLSGNSHDGQPFQTKLRTRTAFRDIRVAGKQIILNGNPIVVRGLLNWGYAPPSNAPSLDENFMRNEIEVAKSLGFNLMKFCLWIPPKRYLELCDEMGILAWIEYPTWHPDFSEEHLENLRREYAEFFHYDRNHPSVVLRSLTCETGPSADINVVRELYNLCKKEIPDAIVEDDSSWIEWNRIHDFYDDHPYGNNHTWPATLNRLSQFIDEREHKPLVLGEAIAADTWVDPADVASLPIDAFYRPWFVDANAAWLAKLSAAGADLATFDQRSKRYAFLMRKFQIEKFREAVPSGGYVVSVIRDFPKASMGLIDYSGNLKWKARDWSFQGDDCLLLKTPHDGRSFFLDEDKFHLPVLVQRGVLPAADASEIELPNLTFSSKIFHQGNPSSYDQLKRSPAPVSFTYSATASYGESQDKKKTIHNEWSLWGFPRNQVDDNVVAVRYDNLSLADEELGITTVDSSDIANSANCITLASRLTSELVESLNAGGRVILFPNGEKNSFPLNEHWFLRGGPVVIRNESFPEVPTDLLVDLQHFDLAGPVIPNIDSMLDSIEPFLLLWDNHDMREVRTHGLVFAIPIGKGQLVVSALNHSRETNAAGQWLLKEFVNHLAKQELAETEKSKSNYQRLTVELLRKEFPLHARDWRFQPDPDVVGEREEWFSSNFDDSSWLRIKCDRHWESQGYPALDDWAWYRLNVELTKEWQAEKLYLNFTGVDDHYRLWVNGQFVGQDGNIATKETAFDNRRSYDITKLVKPGDPIQIAIAVYDWYGAGGIFRPVTISTTPLSEDRPWLK